MYFSNFLQWRKKLFFKLIFLRNRFSIHAVYAHITLKTLKKQRDLLYSKQDSQPSGSDRKHVFIHWVTLLWTAAVHTILITVTFKTTTRFSSYFILLKSCLSELMSEVSECWNQGNAESWGEQPIKSILVMQSFEEAQGSDHLKVPLRISKVCGYHM